MNSRVEQLLAIAEQHDRNDPLAAKQQAFSLPENIVYLDGNSLGPLPINAKLRAKEVVENEWGEGLITSWNLHNWIDLPRITGDKIANLIGAEKGQVICCDSISVNLFKVLSAALQLNPKRTKVLTTNDNFPTDGYMVQGVSQLVGEQRCKLICVDEADILAYLTDDISVLMLTQVNFRTGNKLDIEMITQRAHDVGILVIWDLAHSAGVVPVLLDEWGVDFAVGCGYKFLNGGPGAPAFIYVAERWHQQYRQPLQGWMGHAKPFAFDESYLGASGIQQNLVGTPSIVSMSLLDAALDVFSDINIETVYTKSQKLVDWFLTLAQNMDLVKHFGVITPSGASHRGAQLAFTHEHAYAICQALIASNVITDFRSPNILRLGFSPLFLSYVDLVKAAICLSDIMETGRFREPQYSIKNKVT